jgi:hypothetical protein
MFWLWLGLNLLQAHEMSKKRAQKIGALEESLKGIRSPRKRKMILAEIEQIRKAPYNLTAGADAVIGVNEKVASGD